MWKSTFYLLTLATLVCLNSCRSTSSMTYLTDMKDSALNEQPRESAKNLLRTGNNLYVNIQSANEEVSKLFNATTTVQTGSSMRYSEPADQFVYGYTIDKEGFITLPVIGKAEVAGLTQEEAQARIQLLANKYLKDSSVKLKLLNFKITCLGEVKMPGVYYNYNSELNVFEAASMAGGFTDMARIDDILVMRKTAEGTKSFRLNLTSKGVLSHPAYYLQPNDVVYARPANAKAFSLNLPAISLVFSTLALLLVFKQL